MVGEREAEEDEYLPGEERDRGSDTGKWMKSSFMYLQGLLLYSSLVNTKSNCMKRHAGFLNVHEDIVCMADLQFKFVLVVCI